MTIPVGRLARLARTYMNETVDIKRTSRSGSTLATATIVDDAPAYRILTAGAFQAQQGPDVIVLVRFMVESAAALRAGDVLVDAAGDQYRVHEAAQLRPGLPWELRASRVR